MKATSKKSTIVSESQTTNKETPAMENTESTTKINLIISELKKLMRDAKKLSYAMDSAIEVSKGMQTKHNRLVNQLTRKQKGLFQLTYQEEKILFDKVTPVELAKKVSELEAEQVKVTAFIETFNAACMESILTINKTGYSDLDTASKMAEELKVKLANRS